MIFWRDGKAGFVGAAKRLIKGFFQYQYSVTSATVVIPEADITKRFTIKMGPDDRALSMAYDDRTIRMPPNNRKTKL